MKLFKRVLPYLIAVSMATNGYAVPLLATTSDTTTGGSTEQATAVTTLNELIPVLEKLTEGSMEEGFTTPYKINEDSNTIQVTNNATINLNNQPIQLKQDDVTLFTVKPDYKFTINGVPRDGSRLEAISTYTNPNKGDVTKGIDLSYGSTLTLKNLTFHNTGDSGLLITGSMEDKNPKPATINLTDVLI